MKKIYFILLVTLLSCSHTGTRKPAEENSTPQYQEIDQFQELVEEALVWRTQSVEFANLHQEKFKKENLSHLEMLNIYESAKNYLSLREKILILAHQYEDLVAENTVINYTLEEKTSIQKVDPPLPNLENKLPQTIYTINPTDSAGRDLLIKIKISLSAALVLYDNYMISIYPYMKNKKTRKMLNQDIPEFKSKLNKITDSFFDLENRNKMVRAISLFKMDLNYKEKNKLETNKQEKYLEMLALSSPFYNFIAEKHIGIESPGTVRAYFDRFFDRVRFMNDTFSFITSKIFGNTLGLVSFREGLLKHLPNSEKKEISDELKPLDIMLEKTPFRLTDQFIPGYYGHVAIWIGNEEELRALNVWDHPAVKKFQNEIIAGKRIIEALRPGVQINSLEHFLNIDDLLVLRDNNLSLEQRQEFIIRAFEQIGKAYDFNFDVETDSKIVCSEIVYVVFHDIDWPTKKALGRYTISPDNVASKALDDILEPILLYKSGSRENGNLMPILKNLLQN